MVPIIPAPETEISAPAEVKTGADCNRRKLREQTKVSRSQYDAAKAAIGQSEASVKDAQMQLSYTNITAPAGQIGRKSVEVGQRVQPGTPLMAIVTNDLWLVANFKETQLANMKPGQKVEIKLDAFDSRNFEGRLDSFSPASGAQNSPYCLPIMLRAISPKLCSGFR
jgi:multidrug resistance efflux pump